jgi:hypothetical protein
MLLLLLFSFSFVRLCFVFPESEQYVEYRVENVPTPAAGWCHYCSSVRCVGNPAILLDKTAREGF